MENRLIQKQRCKTTLLYLTVRLVVTSTVIIFWASKQKYTEIVSAKLLFRMQIFNNTDIKALIDANPINTLSSKP